MSASRQKTENTNTPAPDNGGQTLAHAVKSSMDRYFQQLDGHEASEIYNLVLEEVERPLFESVLNYYGGNQSNAARALGLNRGTLRKKLRQYGLIS